MIVQNENACLPPQMELGLQNTHSLPMGTQGAALMQCVHSCNS